MKRTLIIESLKPFNIDNPKKDLKQYEGITCKLDGQPIYRRTREALNSEEEDILIPHNNIEDFKH